MKELTSYNRVAGYLNKVFDLLNAEFFENALSRPTITIQSTPRAYGHFSLRDDTWVSKLGGTHEINIGAGTLARPIEEVTATLLHEMVHLPVNQNRAVFQIDIRPFQTVALIDTQTAIPSQQIRRFCIGAVEIIIQYGKLFPIE